MTTIEYEDMWVSVPDSWADIPLGFYETFYVDRPRTARERVAWVAKVCRTDADALLNCPVDVFNAIAARLDFLFEDNPADPDPFIEIGGVRYMIRIEEKMSLGEWVDADEIQRQGEHVLSNILAVVCRPVNEIYDAENNKARAAMFAALPVSRVQGLLAFFLHCKTAFDQRTNAFSKLRELLDELQRNTARLRNVGGGIKLSRIWLVPTYYVLIGLLDYRLRRFLRSCSICSTKGKPKKRNRK